MSREKTLTSDRLWTFSKDLNVHPPPFPATDGKKKTFRDGCESDCQSIIKTQGNASDLVYQTQVQ